MCKIKHLFFDLDHTLWDYEKNAGETLRELIIQFREHIPQDVNLDDFLISYFDTVKVLWKDYREGTLSAPKLREIRFPMVFEKIGIPYGKWMDDFSDDYLKICPTKPHLFPGVKETLEFLSEKFPCHIITNGFTEVQKIKIKSSGIEPYLSTITTSDLAGAKKPDSRIFSSALSIAKSLPDESLYVGDNYEVDIIGGKSMGMHVVFFNPQRLSNPGSFPEIERFNQLRGFF